MQKIILFGVVLQYSGLLIIAVYLPRTKRFDDGQVYLVVCSYLFGKLLQQQRSMFAQTGHLSLQIVTFPIPLVHGQTVMQLTQPLSSR